MAGPVGAYLVGPLLTVGAVLADPVQTWIWLAAALIDLVTPTLLRRRLATVHVDAGHLTERFGLFVLIALGQSLVAIGTPIAGLPDVAPLSYLATGLAFAVTVALWWVYFHHAAQAMRFALATADVQFTVTRHVLTYAHLAFTVAIVLVAVGMAEAVAHPDEHLSRVVSVLLVGGCAIFLTTFGYTRWVMFHLISRTRLTAAAAVLVLLPLFWLLPAWLTLLGMLTVLGTLNLVELRGAHQAARPVPAT